MTPRDFFYWMQGFFELCVAAEITSDLNQQKMFDCIMAHANVVRTTPGKFSPELLAGVEWIATAIELDAPLKRIQDKVADVFIHVIDTPSNEPNLHDAYGSWENPVPGMKC